MRSRVNRIARRRSRSDHVTILIPAYMAEEFIDRTLLLARGQTHRHLSIVVSIDQSSDGTADVVQRHVDVDQRVTSFVHDERLGWAANVNFLLDHVTSDFSFLYFHDDVIVPQYTEKLVEAAARRPDAATVHCDMGHFGGRTDVARGRSYDGTPTERLLRLFLAPYRGSLLRSLTRTNLTHSVRMPDNAVAGLWANEPFITKLIAAGPAVHVEQTLYYRWDQRSGGLTDGWKDLTEYEVFAGRKQNIATTIEIASAWAADAREEQALLAAVLLYVVPPLCAIEEQSGVTLFESRDQVHPALGDLVMPPALSRFGPEIHQWAEDRWQSIVSRKPSMQS